MNFDYRRQQLSPNRSRRFVGRDYTFRRARRSSRPRGRAIRSGHVGRDRLLSLPHSANSGGFGGGAVDRDHHGSVGEALVVSHLPTLLGWLVGVRQRAQKAEYCRTLRRRDELAFATKWLRAARIASPPARREGRVRDRRRQARGAPEDLADRLGHLGAHVRQRIRPGRRKYGDDRTGTKEIARTDYRTIDGARAATAITRCACRPAGARAGGAYRRSGGDRFATALVRGSRGACAASGPRSSTSGLLALACRSARQGVTASHGGHGDHATRRSWRLLAWVRGDARRAEISAPKLKSRFRGT